MKRSKSVFISFLVLRSEEVLKIYVCTYIVYTYELTYAITKTRVHTIIASYKNMRMEMSVFFFVLFGGNETIRALHSAICS